MLHSKIQICNLVGLFHFHTKPYQGFLKEAHQREGIFDNKLLIKQNRLLFPNCFLTNFVYVFVCVWGGGGRDKAATEGNKDMIGGSHH